MKADTINRDDLDHEEAESWSTEELIEIAKRQRRVIGMIVLAFFAGALSIYIRYVPLVVGLITGIMVYDLARILRSQHPGLFFFCSFIPLVNVIVLVALNSTATTILREHGIRVGLLGARKDALDILKQTEATRHSTAQSTSVCPKRSFTST